ncbi:hypothetical protein T4D_12334 [Trichinella pseudospiralis]|uniref:Uncharacterized protein n=1 Tax=Trichinella pseudospiralis TaxID=6337 RepID=A0A0V1G4E0_TRIPS|nr:hypothetical protein T4D_12334 [Trichinella pseudospiralis]
MRFRAFVNNYLSVQFFRMYFFFLNADLISENITSLNSAISSSSYCQRAIRNVELAMITVKCIFSVIGSIRRKKCEGFTLLFCGAPILHFNLIL